MRRRKAKGKGKGKGRSKRTGRAMNKRKILNGGKKTQFGGRACQKGNDGFHMRVVFALTNWTKVQARTFTKTKAEERIKKEKAKKEPILNPNSQPPKHLMKKDMARPGNQTIGLPVTGLTTPGLQMLGGSAQGLILHGWWQPVESCQPSNTCCSGPWLHTVDWIKSGDQNIQEACMVLWHYDGILPL